MRLDVATVLNATQANVVVLKADGSVVQGALGAADLQREFSGVSIDSRSCSEDNLFVALHGERLDGNEFILEALIKGASGCLVERVPQGVTNGGTKLKGDRYVFVVSNALAALQTLASFWRSLRQATVVGVTGSIGKTMTKEVVAGVLSSRFETLRSHANLNTEIGVPLTLLQLQEKHQVAVIEMGMYLPGDIALLTKIAQPDIGVVTNVAAIHLSRAGSIQAIARGKSELVAGLSAQGLAVLNGDDPWTRAMARASGVAPSIMVGIGEDCDYQAAHVESSGLAGISFLLRAENGEHSFRSGVPGRHTLHAFLFAIAIGRRLKMDWEHLKSAVETVRVDVRQRIIRRPGNLIIDDSYNAAPISVAAALDLIDGVPGRKIAVLGDMLELGDEEEPGHRQIGKRVAEVADWVVLRGPRTTWIAEEAVSNGFDANRVVQARDNEQAAAVVREIIAGRASEEIKTSPGDWVVLVKGSRGMKMEEVVQSLENGA